MQLHTSIKLKGKTPDLFYGVVLLQVCQVAEANRGVQTRPWNQQRMLVLVIPYSLVMTFSTLAGSPLHLASHLISPLRMEYGVIDEEPDGRRPERSTAGSPLSLIRVPPKVPPLGTFVALPRRPPEKNPPALCLSAPPVRPSLLVLIVTNPW